MRSLQLAEIPRLFCSQGKTLSWRQLEKASNRRAINALSAARDGFECHAACAKDSLGGVEPRNDAAGLDAC